MGQPPLLCLCFFQKVVLVWVVAIRRQPPEYTSLSPLRVQARHLFKLPLVVFTVSSLPRAAGKPPRAYALRGLTEAFPPAGVFVYSGGWRGNIYALLGRAVRNPNPF